MAEPAPRLITEWDALRYFRWIQPYDFWVGGLTIVTGLASLVWGLVTHRWLLPLCIAAEAGLFLGLWSVVLSYRVSYFVLLLMAEIKMLPNKAAKLAIPTMHGEVEDDQAPPPILMNWKLLRSVGWVQAYDYLMAVIVVIGGVLHALLTALGQGHHGLGVAFVTFMVILLWLVRLSYRCGWWVLQVTSDIRNVPNDAVKLILLFQNKP